MQRVHYAWIVAAVRSTPGLLMVPLETEFRWPQTVVSAEVAWGVVVTGGTSMVLAAVVANRWFEERRGMVTGAPSAANATGQLLFLPLMARVVTEHGWRAATLWIGGFGLVGTHVIPACHDHGIGELRAAGLLAMMGVFDIAGTTASGAVAVPVASAAGSGRSESRRRIKWGRRWLGASDRQRRTMRERFSGRGRL